MGQIISQDNLILRREKWKGNGQCVVFVSGTFDLLHPGHVRLLEQARSHGDVLVVGVLGDESFRASAAKNDAKSDVKSDAEKQGPAKNDRGTSDSRKSGVDRSRPITLAAERAEILASLASVDIVVQYEAPALASLVAQFAPDIIVEGGVPMAPARSNEATGGASPEKHAPKVVRIVLEPGYSTARIVERIQQASA